MVAYITDINEFTDSDRKNSYKTTIPTVQNIPFLIIHILHTSNMMLLYRQDARYTDTIVESKVRVVYIQGVLYADVQYLVKLNK